MDEYLIGSEYGLKLNEILDDESSEVYTCAVTLAEVVSKVAREGRDVETAYSLLMSNSQIIDANEELFKIRWVSPCGDAIKRKRLWLGRRLCAGTARKLKSKILTGDAHFKNVKDAVLIK